jgi:hypothetical protein
MRGECTSDDCGKSLRPGEPIIQITTGEFVAGYLTPYLSPVDTHNWHTECFCEYSIREQAAPYSCMTCNQQIKDGERVIYACRGTMPYKGYIRAENRGDTILYIAHLTHR